jgi:spermidine synthase
LPLVLLLSFGSGIAALIYEVVWFQLLELSLGSTTVSLSVILATFMGGMCAGSLLLPRLVSSRFHSLRVYAAIEIGIGVLAIFQPGFLLRGGLAAACLLPPTLLMGATLPALARSAARGASALGLVYAVNLAGAVFGSLLSGFYLLRHYDTNTATYIAAALNTILGAAALAFSALRRDGRTPTLSRSSDAGTPATYVAIALSGFCALASEAIWTRTLGLLFGASVYTLSLILAVFLTGLGLGSGLGSLLCRVVARPRQALGWCQLLAAAGIAWTAYTINSSLPYWPINPAISSNIWFTFQLDLARAYWAVLPATLLWGASFPLALAAATSEGHDSGELVAGIYSANTVGAVAGALCAGLLLVPRLGSQGAQQVLIAVGAAASVILLWPRLRSIATLAVFAAVLLIRSVPPLAGLLVAHGRYAATWVGKGEVVYAAEGINSSVAVAKYPDGVLTFHVAGKIQASNVARDMRLQRMLGHLTTLTAAHPRSVLVIGCGAGVTAGAVSIDPKVEQETIVEIEPLVPQAAGAYFKDANFDVLHNPKVQVHTDDGRHYLLTSKDRFDGITVDPLDPWVKGAASLYTKEFLQVMKDHLNPGGSVTMYIQLFETNLAAVKSAVATFFEIFPNATIWGNPYGGRGHDMVLLGTAEPLRIDLDEMERRVDFRGDSKIAQSLSEVGIHSPVELFATYAGRKSDLTDWLKGAAINRDRNLRMQYLAGFGLDADESAAIYASLLTFRRFPEDLFTSAEGRVNSLRQLVNRGR